MFLNEISELLPNGLYQSGTLTNKLAEQALKLGIDLMVDLAAGPLCTKLPSWRLTQISFPIEDGPIGNVAVVDLISLAKELATSMKEGSVVLVRCQAGLNRSGLLNGLILCELGMKNDVVDYIRTKRDPMALCNYEFAGFLRKHQLSKVSKLLIPG